MFVLSKLLGSLLLPPGLFLLLLLGALYAHKRRRLLLSLALLGIYLLAIRPIADALLYPLESTSLPPVQPVCDVLVVLGGQPGAGVPEPPYKLQPSASSLRRAQAAFAFWRKTPSSILLSGGPPDGSAQEMDAYLKTLGVHRDFLILEQQSQNTYEKAQYSSEMLKKGGFRSPCVITSAYQMLRAVRSFAAFEVQVTALPTDYLTWRRAYGWQNILPSAHSLLLSTMVLKEYLGLLYYRLVYGV